MRVEILHSFNLFVQEVKGFREEIGESLNRIESRIKTISERDNTSRIENTEWVNEIKKLGKLNIR